MLVPVWPYQPSLMFVSKARSLPSSGSLDRCLTWVGASLNCKRWTSIGRLARDKHYCFPRKFVDCGHKMFYNIGPLGILAVEKGTCPIPLSILAFWMSFSSSSRSSLLEQMVLKIYSLLEKTCFQIKPKFITEDYCVQRMNITIE